MTVTHYIYYESIIILQLVCACACMWSCVFASGEMTGLEYNINYTPQDIYSRDGVNRILLWETQKNCVVYKALFADLYKAFIPVIAM